MNLKSITNAKENVFWLNNTQRFLAKHGEHVALGLMIAIVSIINIVWLAQEKYISGRVFQFYLSLDFPEARLGIPDTWAMTPTELAQTLLKSEYVLRPSPNLVDRELSKIDTSDDRDAHRSPG